MLRTAWSRLTVALIALCALALVSCFHDVGECPTCPGVNSGSIEVAVPQFGLVDSVQVRMDGGGQVSVQRNRRYAFVDLSAATHEVTLLRWFSIDGSVTSRASLLRIKLDRGERRVIVFHNDFPLVTWAPTYGPGRPDRHRARAPIVPRMG
jgi:hypothetical protein